MHNDSGYYESMYYLKAEEVINKINELIKE